MTITYTGIGSRKIPDKYYYILEEITTYLNSYGLFVRSGSARGSDTIFENIHKSNGRYYLPWDGFNNRTEDEIHPVPVFYDNYNFAIKLARSIHPRYDKLDDFGKLFHNRNMYQILGDDLKSPTSFVVFYAPEENNKIKGGTASAVNLARNLNIPTVNVYKESYIDDLEYIVDYFL